jgi:hypothetical protein
VTHHLRGRGVWVVALAVATTFTTVLLSRDHDWLGDPLWGQETLGAAQVMVLPLVAGAAAVTGGRDRATYFTFLPPGMAQLRHVVRTLTGWATPLSATYAVAHVAVVLLSARAATAVANAEAWPLVTQVLGMVLALSVGYCLGFALRSWAASLVAATLMAGTLILDRLGRLPVGLAEDGSSGTMLGAQPVAHHFLLRIVWLLLVAAVAAGWVVVGTRGRRVLVGGLLATVVAGASVLPRGESYAFSASGSSHCAGTAPRVCGPHELAGRVDEAAALAARASAALRLLHVTPPTALTAWEPATDGKDTVALYNPGRFRDPLDPQEVVSAVTSPKSCDIWRSSTWPPLKWFAADHLVRAWVSGQLGVQGGDDYALLRKRLGAAEAHRLLTAAATGLATCDADAVPDELNG